MRCPRPPSPSCLPRLACTAWAVALLALAPPGGGAPADAADRGQAPAPRSRAITVEAARVAQAAAGLAEEEAVRQLAGAFAVPPRQVGDLRDQKLGFADVAATLAVARAAGVVPNAVLALWANERLSWDEVAARLGAPSAHVIRLLRRARRALDAAAAG